MALKGGASKGAQERAGIGAGIVIALVCLPWSAPAASAEAFVKAGASPTPTEARLSLKPDRGFYDDPWALDPAGKRLALIHTNRDDFQRVEIFDLETAKATPASTFNLSPPSRIFESLSFLPDGGGLFLVSAGPADTHVVEAIDLSGKSLGRTGPVSGFGTATQGTDSVLVTLERRLGRAGEVTYVVSPLKLPVMKPTGKPRSYLVGGDGALRSAALIPVAFFDGYSKWLTIRPGAYDKKRDARQPDGQSVLDLLSGKPVSDGPIEDVTGWARTTRLRRERPNRTAFVQLADALATKTDAQTGIDLLDPAGRLIPLPLAVPFRLYDRLTLKDQEGPAPGVLHFGIQVDPVNADAVARKKADQPALDLYAVSVAHPGTTRLRARVAMDTRPVVWAAAGDRLAVLRRFKSFARGGDRIDVYDLQP
jgi:hypothetical protein